MNYAHLDSSHLIRALGAFLSGSDFESDELAIDSIDLLSHFLCRKELFFDGDVFPKQRAELASIIEKIQKKLSPAAGVVLERKIQAVSFKMEDEDPLIRRAMGKTAANADRLRREVADLDRQLATCSNIVSADGFSRSVEQELLPRLSGLTPSPEIETIRHNEKIAGRRFIWAALSDDAVRIELQKAALKTTEPVKLFQLLFSQFRAEFAVERNAKLATERNLDPKEIFYAPEMARADLLEIALQGNAAAPIAPQELAAAIGKTAQSAWFKRTGRETKSRYLPLSLAFALSRDGTARLRPIDFLNLALEHSASPEAGTLAASFNSLPRHFIGHHSQQKLLAAFEDDLALERTHHETALPLGNTMEEVTFLLVLCGLIAAGPVGIGIGLITTAIPYSLWRLRVTRRKAAGIAEVLPSGWDEARYAERYKTIFGRDVPLR
ncbi:MAG: hypothetical protein ABIZ81_18310 [Opitutaceae bacterium]